MCLHSYSLAPLFSSVETGCKSIVCIYYRSDTVIHLQQLIYLLWSAPQWIQSLSREPVLGPLVHHRTSCNLHLGQFRAPMPLTTMLWGCRRNLEYMGRTCEALLSVTRAQDWITDLQGVPQDWRLYWSIWDLNIIIFSALSCRCIFLRSGVPPGKSSPQTQPWNSHGQNKTLHRYKEGQFSLTAKHSFLSSLANSLYVPPGICVTSRQRSFTWAEPCNHSP